MERAKIQFTCGFDVWTARRVKVNVLEIKMNDVSYIANA